MKVSGCSTLVIADPCYVLQDDVYDHEFLKLENYNGVIGNNLGLVHGTYYGDGSYYSLSGMNYGVDAGSLGIYDTVCCKPEYRSDSVKEIDIDPNKEHLIELEYDNGSFYFSIDGKIVEEIYTAPDDEDEDEDEEIWNDEEDED